MSNHKPITEEMITDLSLMGDKDFAKKWNTSRQYPIRVRKRLGIKSYNNQYGTVEHRFQNNIEEKWCQTGHWEAVSNFYKMSSRRDGLRGWCKTCTEEIRRSKYKDKEKIRQGLWKKSETGKTSLRNTWRKQKAIKKDAYVLWEHEHKIVAYEVFDGACAYCGVKVPFLKIEFDHFVPIKNGGKTEPSNMLPCCRKCNHGVGGKFTKDAWEWLNEKFGKERASFIYNDCRQKLGLI